MEITDKEILVSICEAIKNARIEETKSEGLSKGAIKMTVFCGDEAEKMFLCDDLIFIVDKVGMAQNRS